MSGYDPNTYGGGVVDFIYDFVAGRETIAEAELTAWREDLLAQGENWFLSLSRFAFVAAA